MMKKLQLPQQLKSVLDKLPKKNGGKRLLLVESDGFTLRALSVQLQGETLTIVQDVASRAIAPVVALTDIVTQLKELEATLPDKALLVSSNAITALLKLPVNNAKQLAKDKMAELVRWEMETLFSEQMSLWNVGWLLIGRGYINEEQRDKVLSEIELGDPENRRSNRAPARFGEVAISMGFITRTQLEECLEMQEQLHLLDDSLQCTWAEQPISTGPQPGLWLCAAISPELKQGWVEAFAVHNVSLQWIYPSTIAPAALLPETAGTQVLVYLHQSCVACCQVSQGQVIQFTQQKCSDNSITEGELLELLQPMLNSEVSDVWVTGNHKRRDSLVESLSHSVERSFKSLDEYAAQNNDLGDELEARDSLGLTALLGALRHHAKQSPTLSSVCLRGKPLPPPLYTQPRMQIAAAVALCFATVGINESYYIWKENAVIEEVRVNEEKISKITLINEKLAKQNKEFTGLDTERTELKTEFEQLRASKESVEVVLVNRQRFTNALLPMLSSNVNDGLVLTSVNEKDWYEFEITGWAKDQESIDRFNQSLSRALGDWSLHVSDSPSEAGEGWRKLPGYVFSFTIESKG